MLSTLHQLKIATVTAKNFNNPSVYQPLGKHESCRIASVLKDQNSLSHHQEEQGRRSISLVLLFHFHRRQSKCLSLPNLSKPRQLNDCICEDDNDEEMLLKLPLIGQSALKHAAVC